MGLPALLVLALSASAATAQLVARPVPYPPASIAWGVSLRFFFESDFGKSAALPPALEALRPIDFVSAEGRRQAGPFALALAARGVSPGRFASLPGHQGLEELTAAAAAVARGDLPPPEALLQKAEATAEALGVPAEPAYLRMRNAADGRESARLAGEFAAGLRRTDDSTMKREYVNALWEAAEAPPSPRAHRIAARALVREMGRRRATDAQRILVLHAMKALGGKTPYEAVELALVRAALDLSRSAFRDKVAGEADFTAESLATLSPFEGVRRLAARQFREAAQWAADEDRRRELERRADALAAGPSPGYWPAWKHPRPPDAWTRLLALIGLRLVK